MTFFNKKQIPMPPVTVLIPKLMHQNSRKELYLSHMPMVEEEASTKDRMESDTNS